MQNFAMLKCLLEENKADLRVLRSYCSLSPLSFGLASSSCSHKWLSDSCLRTPFIPSCHHPEIPEGAEQGLFAHVTQVLPAAHKTVWRSRVKKKT